MKIIPIINSSKKRDQLNNSIYLKYFKTNKNYNINL